jgi:hypothetical protein
MSDAVMGQRLLLAAGITAAGLASPLISKPIYRMLDRRRQREKAAKVQQQLMWASSERSLLRDVRISGLAAMRFRVGHPRLAANLEFSGRTTRGLIKTGDGELDEFLHLDAAEAAMGLAAFTPEVRARLVRILEFADSLEMRDKELVVTVSARLTEEALAGIGRTMIEVVEACRFDMRVAPERLLERFRQDPLPGVRDAALVALLKNHRLSEEGEAIAAELLGGGDIRLGLLAAESLNDRAMVAKFEGLMEGNRGRLAVSEDPEARGALSLDAKAREGALSAAKKS